MNEFETMAIRGHNTMGEWTDPSGATDEHDKLIDQMVHLIIYIRHTNKVDLFGLTVTGALFAAFQLGRQSMREEQ